MERGEVRYTRKQFRGRSQRVKMFNIGSIDMANIAIKSTD